MNNIEITKLSIKEDNIDVHLWFSPKGFLLLMWLFIVLGLGYAIGIHYDSYFRFHAIYLPLIVYLYFRIRDGKAVYDYYDQECFSESEHKYNNKDNEYSEDEEE